MARRNRLVIPLSTDEREAIDRLARMERLYSATVARKLQLEEAEFTSLLL
jgi:hypothetical protein